jgi:hypothetical protein
LLGEETGWVEAALIVEAAARAGGVADREQDGRRPSLQTGCHDPGRRRKARHPGEVSGRKRGRTRSAVLAQVDEIPIAEARKRARRELARIEQGADPLEERAAVRGR